MSVFALEETPALEARTDSILVKYKNETDIRIVRLKKNETVAQAIKRFQRMKKVEYAEPNYLVEASAIPSDTSYTNQWYLKRIHAEEAWDINNSSPTITIAIIDSGVQVTHPDIFPNIWKNNSEVPGNKKDDDRNGLVDDLYGWDFVNNVAV
jgi:subtilisin family serine protease